MRQIRVLLLALLAAPSAPFDASAVTITLNGRGTSHVEALVGDAVGVSTVESAFPGSLPDSGEPTITNAADSSSTTDYSLSNASFDFTFDHVRNPAWPSYAWSQIGIFFSPATDLDYALSGSYTTDDPDGRDTFLWVQLRDVTISQFNYTTTYSSLQESRATADESFTLGHTGGDYQNIALGSPTGTLKSGRQYLLLIDSSIQAYPSAATTAAHATGYVALSFVPEPSTGLLLSAGLLAIAIARRKRA